MNPTAAFDLRQVPALLRGESASIRAWMERKEMGRLLLYVAVIMVGTGLFGAAMGSWRDPLQALYTAIKFPLIILLTTLGNGLLNAMLAPLLGVNLTVHQSLLAVLMSFTIAAAILGALSPVLAFLVLNTPPRSPNASVTNTAYNVLLLVQVAMIACAGIAANWRLLQLLRELSGSTRAAGKLLFAWLAGNLLLGSQLSWILRPFVGSPVLDVQFLRPNAFQGNFFEDVFYKLVHLLSP